MTDTIIFRARRIITMNPHQPDATHVAVRDGRILGVGALSDLQGWGDYTCDDRFADKILMPGLVEAHCHIQEGGIWDYCYAGFHDRRGPDGRLWTGLRDAAAVAARLRDAERDLQTDNEPLLAWGVDPVFLAGPRLSRHDLDQVSTRRPIAVLHASGIVMTVNTAMLALAGIDRNTPIDGIARDTDGMPTGELQTFASMFLVFQQIGNAYFAAAHRPAGIWNFGRVAQLAGVTTAADMLTEFTDENLENLRRITADPAFPLRIVTALGARYQSAEAGIAMLARWRGESTGKLRFGPVKIAVDGSIQGFTARLRWPGYFNGKPNGVWMAAPQQVAELVAAYHRAGCQVNIHANGDEAIDVALEAIERALTDQPRTDHRHTLQHCQMADASQFRRMASLGVGANLFINHLYYWGEVHHGTTLGPDRARRMNATRTARRMGVRLAMHSDAPITPIGPLFSAWCAVNRRTSAGRVLGEAECLTVEEALRTITLGGAYALRREHELGSIEVGKLADFAVLEDDPLAGDPLALKDVRVWGTVLGGKVFASPRMETA